MEECKRVNYSDFLKNLKFTDEEVNTYNDELTVVMMRKLADEHTTRHLMPFQLEAFTVMLVQEGEFNMTVDYIPYRLKKNMISVIVGIHVTNSVYASEDFKGYHVVVNREFFRSVVKDEEFPSPKMLQSQRLNPVSKLDDDEFNLLLGIVERLRNNIRRKEHHSQHVLVRNELSNLTAEIREIKLRKLSEETSYRTPNHYEELTMQFFELVFHNYKTEHEVAFYANELCITPVYLSRTIKQATGKTPIKLIGEVIMSEAKILLRNLNLSVQQISEELNFSDQASFSKFFKKHTGKSPLEFRKEATGQ
ncbi:MAG: helix-turn-helix domain-containing protein [Bacteroidales bacterium]|jgi:AraC-like DNA-binding protein|nr:helix-turn-helix domain-containing protein [Bacteroidales bacterium]